MNPADVLNEIAQQVKVCQRCTLHHSRKNGVPGEGPADAQIMLIGEGPGFYENEQGRPFVGAAGKFLEELLGKVNLKREQVFIANVVKCRPPGNRDPMPEELEACSDYLERQIQAINPRIVVTLGRYSMARFLPNAKISDIHGQSVWVRGRLIVPMYHPAAALHQPSLRPALEKDFAKLPEYVKAAKNAPKTQSVEPDASPAVHPAVQAPVQAAFDLPLLPSTPPAPESDENKPENDKPVQLTLF